jgi:hypothetical protein
MFGFWFKKFGIHGGRAFQKTVGIPMRTNCDPFLTDFMQELLKKTEKKLSHLLTSLSAI